jgi:hypothetical protein
MAELGCGTNRAYAYKFPGTTLEGEFANASDIRWTRIRDDISTAQVTVSTSECCGLLSTIRCGEHELRIIRNNDTARPVWEGPITRIEFGRDTTTIYAQDMLWWMHKKVMDSFEDYRHPNPAGIVPQVMWTQLAYWGYGYDVAGNPDRYRMKGRVHWVKGPKEPKTSRYVEQFQVTVWEYIDSYAEDYGADYSTVGRDIYIFDTHLRWKILPTLTAAVLGGWPNVTEYGSEMANRVWFSNSVGFYGYAEKYPCPPGNAKDIPIEMLVTSTSENAGQMPPYGSAAWNRLKAEFNETAARNLAGRCPAPTRIWLPSGTVLLPKAPVDIKDLIPGAWTLLSTDQMCRKVTQWQKLDRVEVSETPSTGEEVRITLGTAPDNPVAPI